MNISPISMMANRMSFKCAKCDAVKDVVNQDTQPKTSETEDKIVKAIAEKSEVEIPKALIDNQIENDIREMEYRMKYQGLDMQTYLKLTNQTMDDFKKSREGQATEQIKIQLVLDKIIK